MGHPVFVLVHVRGPTKVCYLVTSVPRILHTRIRGAVTAYKSAVTKWFLC